MEPRGPHSTVSDNFQIIHNIHNQDLANRESQNICNEINNDLDFCSPKPLHRNLILAGDFNISTVPGRRFSYANPEPVVEAKFSNSDRMVPDLRSYWQMYVWCNWTVVCQPGIAKPRIQGQVLTAYSPITTMDLPNFQMGYQHSRGS